MPTARNEAAIDFTEFKRGWRILLLSVVGVAVSINAALLYGFGTLVVPLEAAFGWNKSELQAAITFLFGGAVISLQLVGWFNLRYGMKQVTVISLILLSLGYLGTTQLNGSIWSLYLAFAVLPLIGMGALAVTWTQLLSLWYDRNRGLALAIGLSGTGLTAAVVPRLMSWSIEQWDWRAAFVLLALLNLLLLLPLTLLWFKLSDRAGQRAQGDTSTLLELPGLSFREGMYSTKFWTCNLALALVISSIVGMVTSTVPMLQTKGLPAAEANLIFSGFGIALIFGRMLIGYLLDRLWPPMVAAISLALPAIGCLVYLGGTTEFAPLLLAAVLVGFGAGAEFDIAAFLVARYFGLREYGRLFGVHQGLNTVASALAPLLFAFLLSRTGGYSAMLVYSLACSLIGPLLLLTLGSAPRFVSTPIASHP
ncbi:MFS transporter [Pseudomonas sp. R3.Fl]|jgi:MFS family permease|uniref:MFS transporter n=1 Tax=Pseudomonas TaxID=286 RepID=UPI000730D8E6|nr:MULTISPECIES: MFS transporter [Pseudomonas]KSW22898.1 MFS transporter [Pseudomonas sp. ADP]AMO77650.1 Inner membrane transport protein YdhC [Pseudomonas citronellolis]MCL6692151.1 MFS transporter [Pseudomonas sp. R3.Fl]MDN6875768.1 MFS transporter [Pseudomonas citronellolis]OBP09192.1 MFS transporter [Pseudomonas sp. EGD-AKN5]